MIERGVIANAGIINPLPKGFRMERTISVEELNYYILYWDKVVIPSNNLVYISIPNEQELLGCGVITRPRVSFNGSFQGDMVTEAIMSCQSIVAKNLLADKKTDWVIHQIGNNLCLPNVETEKRSVIKFDLLNALPVPLQDVPINEILEFKLKRKDELTQLHCLLDDLYLDIAKSPDTDLTSRKIVSELASLISNLDTLTLSKFKQVQKYDMSASINISCKEVGIGAAMFMGMLNSGLSMPLSLLGSALSLLKVEIKAAQSHESLPFQNNLKLSFLAQASKVGIIKSP